MSKNIGEIFKEVRKVANTIALTKAGCVDCRFNNNDLCDDCAKEAFKALTEGKLVVPMSEEAILKLINRAPREYPFYKGIQQPVKIPVWTVSNGERKLAKAIYKAQFGERK